MSEQPEPNPASQSRLGWMMILIFFTIGVVVWWQNRQDADRARVQKNLGSQRQAQRNDDHPTLKGLPDAGTADDERPTDVEVMPDQPTASQPVGQTQSEVLERPRSKPPTSTTTPRPKTAKDSPARSGENVFVVKDQRIRDLDGKVVYSGDIDLRPTIDRIRRGELNRHRNDGTTFQNREGRLPRKPQGYYKEYVNPTPGLNGPGPQRIIVGKEGDIWYTADHYKTFTQIYKGDDSPSARKPTQ